MSSVILLSMLMMLLSRITTVTSRIGFWRNWNGTGGGLLISMLVSFDWSNNTDAINVKMDGSVLEKKYSLKSMGYLSLLYWIGAFTLYLLLKLPTRKLQPWFVLWSVFLLRLICISINLPYGYTWNTFVISGLVLLAAIWNYCSLTYCLSWTLGCRYLIDVYLNWLNWSHFLIQSITKFGQHDGRTNNTFTSHLK